MKISHSTEALASFRKKLETFAMIPDAEFEQMTGMMHEKLFKKGEVILAEGQVCKQLYFLFKGLVRKYFLKDGKEINANFYFESDIVSDFESFRFEKPSAFNLVGVEDCIMYYMTKKESTPFFLNEESLHIFLFRFFQQLYFEKEDHSNNFKLLSPEERYQYMLKNNPEYLQRIPVKHLASYLGISRETINRIRKKLS